MNQRRLVLGAAGGGGTLLVVAVLLFAILGPCNLLRGFGRTGSVTHPTPTPTATVTAIATPTPVTTSEPTPTPTPTPTPSATAGLIISSLPVHTGEVGVDYSPVQMVASGGKPPYTWSTNPGALPAGLSLTPGGQMAGTPTAAGSYTPTFHVDDSAGGAAGFTAPITIVPALVATGNACAKLCSVEQGCQTVCGLFGTQSGGSAPYQYAVTSGSLPPGTSLAGLSLGGTFTTPSGAAPYQFAVMVTDALGASRQVSAVFGVFPHIAIFAKNPYGGSASGGTSQNVPFGNGAGTPTPGLSSGIPNGLTATVQGTNVVLAIPKGVAAIGTYNFTLSLTDTSPCGPTPVTNCSTSAAITLVIGR